MESPQAIDTQTTPGRPRWALWTLIGVAGLLLIALASGASGYSRGIDLRQSAQATAEAVKLDEQFRLGLQDMTEGKYELARQRFEYIIRYNPSYPGVQEQLTLAQVSQHRTATPTPQPTIGPTATPDLRGVEELFEQARQNILDSQWTAAIDTLLRVRKEEPELHAVEIDGMLWLALRSRGLEKILNTGDLEEGIYDLVLAERFGPLDAEAKGYMDWARLYIIGASFWELDWGEAVNYFGQIAPILPNLRDSTGFTARERYRQALIGYAGSLVISGLPCEGQAQYELAREMAPLGEFETRYQEAIQACILSLTPTVDPFASPTVDPNVTPDPNLTPTPGETLPAPEPTFTPSPTP